MSTVTNPLKRRLENPWKVGLVFVIFLSSFALSSNDQVPTVKLAPYSESLPNSVVKIKMVPIPGGSTNIGGTMATVKPFYMATTETVWEAFDLFLTSGDPSKPYDQTVFKPDAIARPSRSYHLPDHGWGHRGYPAISIAFDSADMFCRWLSSVTGKKYRLPTEAEWDIACRAGAKGPWKLDAASMEAQSWNFTNCPDETTMPVATKKSNAFGLFDMLGNVGEWTTDSNHKPVLCGPTFQDPVDKVNPSERKRLIPAWQESDPQIPKSRWWLSDAPFCGFRVVCEG
jgi:formylglycine-generating enzyme required for sulfatase activity